MKPQTWRRWKSAWAVIALMGMARGVASGLTVWDGGGGDYDWFNDLNWNPDTVPVLDEVRINTACSPENPVFVTGPNIARPAAFSLGYAAGDAGYLVVSNGILQQGNAYPSFFVGNGGYGEMTIQAAGLVTGDRYFYVGQAAGSAGKVTIEAGGTLNIAREIYVGFSGSGTLIAKGNVTNRAFHVGRYVTATGYVELGAITLQMGANEKFCVGNEGRGTVVLRGTYIRDTYNNGDLVARSNATAVGMYRGWGTHFAQRQIVNNGWIVADGEGVERDLDLTSFNGYGSVLAWENTIENTTNHGWYAVNKGRLLLCSLTVPVGSSVTTNWAESQTDEEIDLVNSLRFTFKNVTASGALTGALLAADRSEVPPPPPGATLIGVWNFSFAGTFETFDMEARYDHVAAGDAPVALLRYDAGAGAWQTIGQEPRSGYRIAASNVVPLGASKVGLLAVAATTRKPSGTVVIVR